MSEDGLFPDRNNPDRAPFMDGYRRGEMERVALATANSELRSEILELKNRLRQLYEEVAFFHGG